MAANYTKDIRGEMVKITKDEVEDKDTRCSIGSWKPRCLQRANNPKCLLFFLCMYGMILSKFLYNLKKDFKYNNERGSVAELLFTIIEEISQVL